MTGAVDTAVPAWRLALLRAVYALVVVGLGIVVWPDVLGRGRPWALMEGVVACMLAAFSLLSVLGLRYPLQMLPLLLWELAWKTIWLLAAALPAWAAGRLEGPTRSVAMQCSMVVIVALAIPWRHVVERYGRQRGERWR